MIQKIDLERKKEYMKETTGITFSPEAYVPVYEVKVKAGRSVQT